MKREIIVNELAGLTSEELDRRIKIERLATIILQNKIKAQQIESFERLSISLATVPRTNLGILDRVWSKLSTEALTRIFLKATLKRQKGARK